ncbi:tartrate dehydrogenase [Agaribacter marinus]|uniref:Tartrate dehydrogenase n=1 Tax=Virgibacillus salarius TaxID=447199 RepID=A0A941DTA1_9BACI|nr:isocitrate/isopropylmalate family dehydrogenase [Virgibacillus salarius]MBR7795097.1 tartrate dehydrogenase [Virgibacillus salarius]NAZ07814.1 tartrate dehydrogenase [Agaribacter marinus]
MDYKIAVIPGDGIGVEVMNEALKVLEIINTKESIHITYDIFNWNSDYYLQTSRMMPENGLKQLKEYDAILFGAIGDERVPDDVTLWELIMPIRKSFQQYVNFRPIKLLKGMDTPIRNQSTKPIDFVLIRENAEGEYSNAGGIMFAGEHRELAIQNNIMTKQGVTQIAEFAFSYAQKQNLTKVTNATKSNAIIHSMKFWDRIIEGVAGEYLDISYEKYYIDALATYFVQRPQDFQVVLATNLFGDILSDLGSAIVGGLGISPSANINPAGEFPSMFEPVHGSAPDIAGKGIANPIAQIWSLALLYEQLGRKDIHDKVITTIEALFINKVNLTADMGGTASTTEVGDSVCTILKSL